MGLSLAELFIILVFLLLLATIGYASLTDKKIKEDACPTNFNRDRDIAREKSVGRQSTEASLRL